MQAVADPDPAAVVDAHPGCACGGVNQRVENGPVGDRIRSIAHPLCLAVRAGDRSGIEVVTPDDDGCCQLPRTHHLVDAEPGASALPVAEPADAGRQALERDLLLGQAKPSVQADVGWEELHQGGIGLEDVSWLAGQGRPPEWPFPLAEEWSDEGRHESGEVEGIRHTRLLGLCADVVAVVEDDRTGALEGEHGPDVLGDGLHGPMQVRVRIRCAEIEGLLEGEAGGHIATQRIVCAGLVGDDVGPPPTTDQLGLDLRGVGDEGNRMSVPIGAPAIDRGDRLVEVGRHLVDIASV